MSFLVRAAGLISFSSLLAAAGSVQPVYASPASAGAELMVNPETGETQRQFAARTAWWRNAKFGMFIHWGIYSVPNSDHRNTQGMGEWFFSNHQMQVRDYEKYAAEFNPVKFDARKWVSVARSAGIKYIVITSKHHDGFCMWDSKLTDYNIVKATPFHHDPIADLAKECRRQGIRLCFYHSFMDWHHPDYLPRRPWDERSAEGANLDRFVDYLKGELRELLTHYGPIGGIWFDGGWEHNAAEEHSREVVRLIRSLQPSILINNRLNLPEDYDTPEQTIPAGALPKGRLWETCMTLNDNWGFAWNDHHWKSPEDLVHKICDIAGKGGNFLLNVGPDQLGQIPDESISRLAEVGRWMKTNGGSIYATTKSPYRKPPFDGRITSKGDHLYLQVFHWPDGGLKLPGLKNKIRWARALDGGEPIPFTRSAEDVLIGRPKRLDPYATVVELALQGDPVLSEQSALIRPAADGTLSLLAADAELHGSLQVEERGGKPNVGFWTHSGDSLSWIVQTPRSARYAVRIEYACPGAESGSTYRLQTSNSGVSGVVADTGDWDRFRSETVSGTLELPGGRQELHLVAVSMPGGAVMNLRQITLSPVEKSR